MTYGVHNSCLRPLHHCPWSEGYSRVALYPQRSPTQVFVTHATAFDKPAMLKSVLEPILGAHNLLLVDNGDVHRRHRKLISPAFHFLRLKDMAPTMSAAASCAVDAWLAPLPPALAMGGAPAPHVNVEMHAALTSLTLSIVGEAAFGVRSDEGFAGSAGSDGESVFTALAGLMRDAFDAVLQPLAFIPVAQAHQRARRAPVVARLRAELLRRLEARVMARRAIAVPCETRATHPHPGAPHLLIDFLLDATASPTPEATAGAPVAPLTLTEVLDEAMTFVFAGARGVVGCVPWQSSRVRALCGCTNSSVL